MKKKVLAVLLAAMMIPGAVLTGCSKQAEESSESVSPSSQATEPESSSQPDSSSSEAEASDNSSTIIVVPPVSSGTPEEGQITGALVMTNGDIFGTGTDVLGTDADLDAWNQAISERDSIAGLLVSSRNIDMNTERDLTDEEITTILDTLEGLSPSVMEEMGNPATGGATNVAAFDRNGNRLWSITLNSNWLIVQVAGDSSRRILEIDETDAMPVQNIAS